MTMYRIVTVTDLLKKLGRGGRGSGVPLPSRSLLLETDMNFIKVCHAHVRAIKILHCNK